VSEPAQASPACPGGSEAAPPEAGNAPRQIVLVTGLSGAGKASILRGLEDLGFETVDNPPWPMLAGLLGSGAARPLAAGVDARTAGVDPAAGAEWLAAQRARGLALDLVFATADDDALLRRYSETRRRHPLAPSGRVADGIARERSLLAPLLPLADWVVDTTTLSSPELRRLIEARYGAPGLSVTVQSFAFPRGLPREADIVLDLRFLRNPHYDPALRPLTGRDPAVGAHIAADPDFEPFWQRMTALLDPLLPRYLAEGKKYLCVALGCTGGKHRSVFVAERLAAHWSAQGWRVEVAHRELGQEPARTQAETPHTAS
jgi:UPF0042 nucleotide-binding protein